MPVKPVTQLQLDHSSKFAPSCIHLSLCIVKSRPDSFNICSPGTFEDDGDDEELLSAVSQCEAELNTGEADDINANIVRMFCDNTKKYYFVKNVCFKYIFLHNTELNHIKWDSFFEYTSKP